MITNNDYIKWKNNSRNKLITGEAYVRLNIKTKHKKGNLSFKTNVYTHKSQSNGNKDKPKLSPDNKDKEKENHTNKDVVLITNPKTGIQKTIPLLRKTLRISKLQMNNDSILNNNNNNNASQTFRLYLNPKKQLTSSYISHSIQKKTDDSPPKVNKQITIEDYQTKNRLFINRKVTNRCSSNNSHRQKCHEILSYSHTDRSHSSNHTNNDTFRLKDNCSPMKRKNTKHIISMSIDTVINNANKVNISKCIINGNHSLLDFSQIHNSNSNGNGDNGYTTSNTARVKKAHRPLSRIMYIKKPSNVSYGKPKSERGNQSKLKNITINTNTNKDKDKQKEKTKGRLFKEKRTSSTMLLRKFVPNQKLNTSLNTSNINHSIINRLTISNTINTNTHINTSLTNTNNNQTNPKPMIQVSKKKKSMSVYDNNSIKHNNEIFFCSNNEASDNTSGLDHPLSSRKTNSTNIASKENLIADMPCHSHRQSLIKKKIVKVGSISKTGFSGIGKCKINQDNYAINRTHEGLDCFFICDGHGANGHLVSDFVIETLPNILINEIIDKESSSLIGNQSLIMNKIIENSIILTNSKLSNTIEIDTNLSGTTCSTIIIHNNIVYCINVGDSRTIMGKIGSKGKWTYEPLSRDHKATEGDEANRIRRYGGRIEPYRDSKGPFIGPLRVWLKSKQIPGLAMTRSIGDQIASTVGVTCEPEIKSLVLKEDDKFILMASDGVWEYLSNSDCVEIVSKYYRGKDADSAVEQLYKQAHKKWRENENIIDDITIILIFFD